MKHFVSALFSCAALMAGFAPVLVEAKVAQASPSGFVVRHIAQVSASPEETWAVLLKPSVWWDSDHTWSGDSANLILDARAGGCFCEMLPAPAGTKAPPRGTVEHMRVVYVERPRALRLVGALGPLQADALNGTLTVQLDPGEKAGTRILLEYVVGGFARTSFEKLAPAVDAMLASQVGRLAGKLGGAFSAAFPTPDAGQPAGAIAEPQASGSALEKSGPEVQGVVPLSDVPAPGDGTIVGR